MSEIRNMFYRYRSPMNILARSCDSSLLRYFCGNMPECCQLLHCCLMGIQDQAKCTKESSP
jgi:hypothetical protein